MNTQDIENFEFNKREIINILEAYINVSFRTGSTEIMDKTVHELGTDEDWVLLVNIPLKDLRLLLESKAEKLSNKVVDCNRSEYASYDNRYYIFRYGLLNIICINEKQSKLFYAWAYATFLCKKLKLHHRQERKDFFKYLLDILDNKGKCSNHVINLIASSRFNLPHIITRELLRYITICEIPSHIYDSLVNENI
jgi:hypothetical protein